MDKRCEISFCTDLQDRDKILDALEQTGVRREHVRVYNYLLIRQNQAAVQTAWQMATSGCPVPDHPGDMLIQESWSRCYRFNLDARALPRQPVVDLKVRRGQAATILQAAAGFFPFQLERTLGRRYPRFAAMITDAEGVCVDFTSDPVTASDDPRAGLHIGYSYQEETAGCNAIALALRHRRALIVSGSEHWYCGFHPWISMAAPILDHDDTLSGVLAFWVPIGCASADDYDLLRNLAKVMESSLALSHYESCVQKLEKEIAAVQKENRFLLRSIGRPTIVAKPDLTVAFANPAAIQYFGKSLTIPNVRLNDAAPCLAQELRSGLVSQLDQQASLSFAYEGRKCRLSVLLTERGYVAVGLNAKQTVPENLGHTPQDLQRLLLDELPVAAFVLDHNAQCLWVNRTVQKLTGRAPSEFTGRSVIEMLELLVADANHRDRCASKLLTALHQGTSVRGELLTVTTEDGKRHDFTVDFNPLRDGDQALGLGVTMHPLHRGNSHTFSKTPEVIVPLPDNSMRIGVRWKDIRQYLNMEKQQFANELDLGLSQYLRYENGRSLPSLPTAIHLASKLGRSIEDIYCILESPLA